MMGNSQSEGQSGRVLFCKTPAASHCTDINSMLLSMVHEDSNMSCSCPSLSL